MTRSHTIGHPTDPNATSGEVHQEINRVRDAMDHTLEEIGGYLHPKHLLDFLIDSVRSGRNTKVRELVNHGVCELKRHPGPAALVGAAALWYLSKHNENDDQSQRTSSLGSRRAATYGAWEEGYEWSKASEDEPTWSQRAQEALDQVRSVIANTTMAAKDKVKSVAHQMVGVSGKSREEIHAQWANLRERGGSFVDARTGQPYGNSYGEPWCSSSLEACMCVSDDKTDDSSWSDKAEEIVNSMTGALKSTGDSVKDQFRSLGDLIASLASSAGSRTSQMAAQLASGSRETLTRGWSSAADGLHTAADGARRSAHRLSDAMSHSVEQGRDQFQRALKEQPLAVGAAALGLGLLAGLLVPSTRQEDEMMGEAADRLKDQAREAGEQAVKRGKQVASQALSAASAEADRRGLTPETVGEKVKQLGR